MPASSRSRRAHGSGWLGMGRGRRTEKPLALDLFHVLPNIKLFFLPFCHIALQVLSLPLSQNVYYLPCKGYEEQLQDTTKGSAPKSPSSVPPKKGESLSRSPLVWDSEVVGMEEQMEFDQLSSSPCTFSSSSAQR